MCSSSTKRPDIIYFHSHDTGRYVSPYGYPVLTPNYQRIAEEGVVFRQAFCAAPTCSPSRAALLTGQTPHAAGMLGLAHRGFKLNDPTQHLATTLRDNGYRTMLAGLQHVIVGDPRDLGYTEVADQSARECDDVASAAVAMIESAADSDNPFFLDAGFFETHRVYPEVDESQARYVRPPAPIPDSPATRLDTARYNESARRLDAALGRVLDTLERQCLVDSTIVIVTTDHGLAFPYMKCNLTDHGTGVLLIMRGPEGLTGGRVIDSLVSQIDLFPTLCAVLHIERPDWLTGTSLLPIIDGSREQVNEAVFAEVTFHAAYEPQRMVRTHEWTYIRRFGERRLPVLPNCDDGESRDFLGEHGWAEMPIPFEQLYNNLLDPTQCNNRIDDPAVAEPRDEMKHRLQRWMQETNDPLLAGSVALPVGGRVNDPDSPSFLEPLIEAMPDGTVRTLENPRTLR
ncbi:MAG: sulfatase [Thermomicrobiales bacterium]